MGVLSSRNRRPDSYKLIDYPVGRSCRCVLSETFSWLSELLDRDCSLRPSLVACLRNLQTTGWMDDYHNDETIPGTFKDMHEELVIIGFTVNLIATLSNLHCCVINS